MTSSDADDQDPPDRFQILSLDGGGIRGIFSAAILAALEEDLGGDITDHFDLIAGTSTGGIVALALGYGLRPREVVEFYATHGPQIFGHGLGWFRSLACRKYSQEPLRKALQETFREATLSASKKRLVIPAFSLDADDVYIFRTAHEENLRRDYKVPMWKIALATSAAPTYFPVCTHVDGMRLVDGGVWANNPSMVALVEANGPLKVPLPNVHIFSLGTCGDVPKRPRWLDRGGKVAWGLGAGVETLLKGQSNGATNQARFLIGGNNFLRIDPVIATGDVTLDGIDRAENLIARARHYSRKFAPEYRSRFGSHSAPSFTSLYSVS